MFESERQKIENAIAPFLSEKQFELVELKVTQVSRDTLVELIADKPQGGITIDECTVINRALSEMLEREQWLGENYMISVCSPGMDRPLKTQKDFMRNLGRQVRFHLKEMLYNKLEHHGIIQEVNEEQIIVKTKTDVLNFPLDKIQKAVQIL